MPDILAIISKAVFEADARGAQPGTCLPMDRYNSKNPGLSALAGGGRLFLVTVRPPDEKLWLVAVLEQPKHNGTSWVAKPNAVKISDVSAARGRLRFTSNTGITAKPGALGMSLQTPRALTPADVALLLGGKAKATSTPEPKAEKPRAARPAKAAAPAAPSPTPPRAAATGLSWDTISAALKAKQFPQALGLLLARWDQTRAPEVAALIERVSALTDAPVAGTFAAQLKQAERAHLTPVLDGLTEGVRFAEALTRTVALEKLPPDPRVAGRLTRFLLEPPFTAQSSRDFWNSLFEQLAGRHADPRTAQVLRPVLPRYAEIFGGTVMGAATAKRIARLIEELSRRFATGADEEVPAAILALLPQAAAAPKAPAKGSAEGLLAAVYENADDDGPRQVYADFLLEQGDPRGEFITLQFRKARGETLSAAELKQEQALLKKHHKQWQGPLRDITYADQDVFERGFLAECRLRLLGGKIRAALNHPAWATVRTIHLAIGGTKEHGVSLLTQPAMHGLKELNNAPYDVVRALATEGTEHRLETLGIDWMHFEEGTDEEVFVKEDWEPLLTGKTLRKLRTLKLDGIHHLSSQTLASFWSSPRAAMLERLVLRPLYSLDSSLFADVRTLAPPTLEVEFQLSGFTLRFRRKGPGELETTEVSPARSDDWAFGELKAKLPKSFAVPLKVKGLPSDKLAALQKHLPSAKLTAE